MDDLKIDSEKLKKTLLIILYVFIGIGIGMLIMYFMQKDYVQSAYDFVKINCNNTWGVRIG